MKDANSIPPYREMPWSTIVVIPILLIALGAILYPAFKACGCRPSRVPRVECMANEHQLLDLLFDHASRHNAKLPPDLSVLLPSGSARLAKLTKCPDGQTPYRYLGGSRNLLKTPKDTVLLYEPAGNHIDPKSGKASIMVGYADGRVIEVLDPPAVQLIAELNAGHNPPRPERIK